MRPSRLLPCLLCGAGLALAPSLARAHGIESSLERLGGLSEALDFSRRPDGSPADANRLELRSRFSSGLPATEAAVRLMPADGGEPIEVGHTDAEGRLTFDLPAGTSRDWEIQVDAGPGHRDYLELPGDADSGEGPVPLPIRPGGLVRRSLPAAAPVLMVGLLGGLGGLLRFRRRS